MKTPNRGANPEKELWFLLKWIAEDQEKQAKETGTWPPYEVEFDFNEGEAVVTKPKAKEVAP